MLLLLLFCVIFVINVLTITILCNIYYKYITNTLNKIHLVAITISFCNASRVSSILVCNDKLSNNELNDDDK